MTKDMILAFVWNLILVIGSMIVLGAFVVLLVILYNAIGGTAFFLVTIALTVAAAITVLQHLP